MGTFAEAFGYRFCQQDTDMRTLIAFAVHAHYVYIRRRTVQEQIPHPSADDIAIEAQTVGFFAHHLQHIILYFQP